MTSNRKYMIPMESFAGLELPELEFIRFVNNLPLANKTLNDLVEKLWQIEYEKHIDEMMTARMQEASMPELAMGEMAGGKGSEQRSSQETMFVGDGQPLDTTDAGLKIILISLAYLLASYLLPWLISVISTFTKRKNYTPKKLMIDLNHHQNNIAKNSRKRSSVGHNCADEIAKFKKEEKQFKDPPHY